ncbi:Retinol dehydrogenase 12 [Frankliniella fusca]|uniref:Retinol dehydrogenase 12 n=1 Tax=Frankliniella fusca TaxID=407009 RepID=A0AAE1HRV4_9NEOP|nr:Retinol dehydrogenase 12 [Frankliniella fusca]
MGSSEKIALPPDPTESWWPYILATIVAIISMIRAYMGGKTYKSEKRLEGKVVIVTGANTGIGFEVAKDMASRGAQVVLACRNMALAQAAAAKIVKTCPAAHLDVRELDLASLQSVVDFVQQLPYSNVNILILNAGVVFHPFALTEDGFETHFQVNYLGHFLLTRLLVQTMCVTPGARVISMTSQSHFAADICLHDLNLQINYSARKAYGQSKLALLLMTRYLGLMLQDTNVNFLAVNPGLVRGTKHVSSSPVLRESLMIRLAMQPLMWMFMKSPKQGSQSVIYAALHPELDEIRGAYICDCNVSEPSTLATDKKLAADLFERSLSLVAAKAMAAGLSQVWKTEKNG